MVPSLSRRVCASPEPTVQPGCWGRRRGSGSLMTYVLIGWRTCWCDASQTTNPSALTDRLIMHPQCLLDSHYLFIYATTDDCNDGESTFNTHSFLCFWPPDTSVILSSCKWDNNVAIVSISSAWKRLYIPSACCWILNTFFFISGQVFTIKRSSHFFFFFLKDPQSEDAETLQNICDNVSLLPGGSIIHFPLRLPS